MKSSSLVDWLTPSKSRFFICLGIYNFLKFWATMIIQGFHVAVQHNAKNVLSICSFCQAFNICLSDRRLRNSKHPSFHCSRQFCSKILCTKMLVLKIFTFLEYFFGIHQLVIADTHRTSSFLKVFGLLSGQPI